MKDKDLEPSPPNHVNLPEILTIIKSISWLSVIWCTIQKICLKLLNTSAFEEVAHFEVDKKIWNIKDWISQEQSKKKHLNPLNANPTKWSNTLKQFADELFECVSPFCDISSQRDNDGWKTTFSEVNIFLAEVTFKVTAGNFTKFYQKA